jgi:hypothetical protein
MNYTIEQTPCGNIDIPSCFTGEIKFATTIPNATVVQIVVKLDGRMEVHESTVTAGYVGFAPDMTIYSIPFTVSFDNYEFTLCPFPNYGEVIADVIIN